MIAGNEDEAAPVWGCVLIGGRSRRMGAPKHLLDEKGLAWIEQTVAMLRQKVEQVVICGAGELPASLADAVRVDDVDDLSDRLPVSLLLFVDIRRFPG